MKEYVKKYKLKYRDMEVIESGFFIDEYYLYLGVILDRI